MPRCQAQLVMGESVICHICHIRARRKTGPRYDATLSQQEKDDFRNLILFCPTCHTLIDKTPATYTCDLLTEIKELHERAAPLEISLDVARQAQHLFDLYESKRKPVTTHVIAKGGIAIGRDNFGSISFRQTVNQRKPSSKYPANSIGADANMTNYVEYLCQLYVDYMSPTGQSERERWGRLGRTIKTKFRLRKQTRNHLSAERFPDLVNYLIRDKIAETPIGKRHLARGTKLCRSFEDFRHGLM
jgi:hypothetical protein